MFCFKNRVERENLYNFQDTGPVKICLIIHSLGIGGMERVMSELANNFSSREGVEVHLLLIGLKRNIEYSLASSVHIHRPPFKFKNSRRLLDTFRTFLFIRSKVKEIDPDRVLSFGEMWNNLVLLSLLKSGYPVYISDRSKPDKDLGKMHNRLRDWLYPFASGYIAQTESAKHTCEKKSWNASVRVIGNPIRTIVTDETQPKENTVLTVGRLIKTKHIDQLIRVFHSIKLPGWKLVIVGGDAKKLNLSVDLRKMIEDLDLKDRVFLEGQQNDVERYYRRSRIFAFTSSSEGFPNVIGEALSAGIPVVAYDCVAGPSDMIEDGLNGYLIPLFNEVEFATKLKKLMVDDLQREKMAANAPGSVKKFSVEKISESYFNFMFK